MERTDWLDEGLSPADARFLMLTAITHHTFSSPAWGSTRSASSTPNSPSLTSWSLWQWRRGRHESPGPSDVGSPSRA